MTTIKILGLVNGKPTEFDGQYLVDYNPTPMMDAEGEYIQLETTDNISEARQFRDTQEAIECYMAASEKCLRWDGRPDRPLTAYSVEIE